MKKNILKTKNNKIFDISITSIIFSIITGAICLVMLALCLYEITKERPQTDELVFMESIFVSVMLGFSVVVASMQITLFAFDIKNFSKDKKQSLANIIINGLAWSLMLAYGVYMCFYVWSSQPQSPAPFSSLIIPNVRIIVILGWFIFSNFTKLKGNRQNDFDFVRENCSKSLLMITTIMIALSVTWVFVVIFVQNSRLIRTQYTMSIFWQGVSNFSLLATTIYGLSFLMFILNKSWKSNKQLVVHSVLLSISVAICIGSRFFRWNYNNITVALGVLVVALLLVSYQAFAFIYTSVKLRPQNRSKTYE